jgi:AraC family transcriptional regulator
VHAVYKGEVCMNIDRELFYKEFVRRESNTFRAPYDPELEFYSVIKSGNVAKTRELCKESLLDKPGLGTLSEDYLQNIKYHFVITAALVARYCIEGGMELSVSYGLSDFYIQKADKCKTPQEVADLHPVMCLDYARRMRNLRKKKVCSRHVANCIDYIYDHLHTRITAASLAKFAGLNPSYLSRLFKNETGYTISEYIQARKIDTAKNMLAYSDHSPSQIASILSFPSQSYFTEVFRNRTGMTPLRYRMQYFRKTEIGK